MDPNMDLLLPALAPNDGLLPKLKSRSPMLKLLRELVNVWLEESMDGLGR